MKIVPWIALSLLWLTVGALRAASSPLDTLQPGEWYEAPNTRLDAVKPNPLPPGNSGINSVMGAWSGACYDSTRDRLIVWGGGHADYAGNELYVFSIDFLSWTRLTEPTPTAQIPTGGDFETYLDGLPSSRHTYGGLTYLPTQDRLFARCGSKWQIGYNTTALWEFDFGSSNWSKKATSPESSYGVTSAWDPATQRVFSMGNYKFVEYDPVGDAWITRYDWSGGMWNNATSAAIDTDQHQYVLVGGGKIYCINLDTFARTVPATSGDKSLEGAGNPGFQYDPVAKKFVGWNGGTDVYTLDPTTWVWTKITPAASNTVTPTAANGTGTYGRWRYIASKNCYIGVNAVTQNVYFYKLSAGGGTPSNQPPTIQSPVGATPNPVVNQNTTTLTVTATDSDSGPSPLTYTWSKTSGPGAVAFSPNGTADANVTTATFGAAGTYALTVTVSDGSGSVSNTLTGLTVTLPSAPTIVAQPVDQAVTAGQTATFSVTAGGASPFTYQWQKNGSDISGATGVGYTTPPTADGDNGATYRVVIANAYGSVTSNAVTLTVTAASNPLVVSVTAINLTATTGSTTPATGSFSVQNTGSSTITVTVACGQSWLTVTPATGAIVPAGGAATFTVSADPSGLNGNLQGAVTLTNQPGGLTQSVPITFQVAAGSSGGGGGGGGTTGANVYKRSRGCTVSRGNDGSDAGWLALLLVTGLALRSARRT